MAKSLIKNSVYNAANTVTNSLFSLATSFYASRVLLPEGIGKIAFAQSIAAYFIAFSTLGMPVYGLREIAKIGEDRDKTQRLFSELFCLNSITSAVASIAYFLLVMCIPRLREDFALQMICGIPVVINCFNVDWFFQGKEEYGYIAVRNLTFKAVFLTMILSFVKSKDDYAIYALLSSLATGGNYAMNMAHTRKYVRLQFHGLNIKQHIKPLSVFALALFLSAVYSRVDVTMLGVMVSDTSVGYYENSYKITNLVTGFCTALTAAFMPKFSFFYKTNKALYSELLKKGISVISFVVFPAAAGVCVLAKQYILLIFGTSFAPATLTLQVLSGLIIIIGIGDLVSYQTLISSGNEKVRIPSHTTAMIANIVLNSILIPKYKETGAAIATIITIFIADFYQCIWMKRIIEIKFEVREIVKTLLATLLMTIAVVWSLKLNLSLLRQTILSTSIGVISYLFFSFVFGNRVLTVEVKKIRKKRT